MYNLIKFYRKVVKVRCRKTQMAIVDAQVKRILWHPVTIEHSDLDLNFYGLLKRINIIVIISLT